ncbi:hypothetical protein [Candidatus Entotheonella palauensis]|nr:hypothetical protein [Candidatus Entotheonella palauensis]
MIGTPFAAKLNDMFQDEPDQRGAVKMPENRDTSRLLPTSRAFVLQLRADSRVENGHVAGRVEHVVSGRATHFQSVDELLTFIAGALRETDAAGAEECQ